MTWTLGIVTTWVFWAGVICLHVIDGDALRDIFKMHPHIPARIKFWVAWLSYLIMSLLWPVLLLIAIMMVIKDRE